MKWFTCLLVCILLFQSVFAENLDPTTNVANRGASNNRDDSIQAVNRTRSVDRIRVRNVTRIKERIQEREGEMDEELETLSPKKREVYRNQNRIRKTVHTLLEMREQLNQSGIGQNVSEIAREFNNSVKVTLQVEQRIKTRSKFLRFFIGGDEEAAEDIESEVEQNHQRVEKLKEIRQRLDDEELEEILDGQIQDVESEQERLRELARNEKKSRGIFGWLLRGGVKSSSESS